MSPPLRPFSGLSLKLLAFNLLLVFLPVAGFLYLDVFERELLSQQERAMVQQGRLLAAALAGRESIPPQEATALIQRLDRRIEARLRVVDTKGTLLADSSRGGPPALPAAAVERYGRDLPISPARDSLLYRLGATLYRFWQRRFTPPPPAREVDTYYRAGAPLLGPEVRAALAGRYGAVTRPTGGQRSLTLYSAIPVRGPADPSNRPGEVIGAVLVSQSTLRLRAALVEVRLGIFRVFLGAVLAAIVLSFLIAITIARPLQRLADEARALVDRRGRLLGSFRGSARGDEIGDLARALEELTRRLSGHLRFIESFAADVSHELKNPLAGIRSATELLSEVEDPDDRARFLAVVEREVARMERLLSGMRDITGIDAHLPAEPAPPVDLGALLAELVESARLRTPGVEMALRPSDDAPLVVQASPERLVQLFDNVLDNARSFSPPGGTVTVELAREDGFVRIRVDDPGPGIPEAHRERIFDRFFSYRPGEGKEGHSGLGLAIARAIAEGYGGSITAGPNPGGGARFEVRLPA
ncbi:MAG TPA: ATP-binding protein [Thermoanaerobaculia bacterium]|nr:ATP-binding protein [Thermoanaerobaculia bacterium]